MGEVVKALMKSKPTEQPLFKSLLKAPDTDRNPVANHRKTEHRRERKQQRTAIAAEILVSQEEEVNGENSNCKSK